MATVLPLRWVNLPHQDLCRRALDALQPGSRERAREDALRHGLKRCLRELKPADHRKYVELESARIVESLRAIRDEYRRYLEDEGGKPISKVYWEVFRFGVMPYAVGLLREIASEYVICSEVPFEEWEILYGNCFLPMISTSGRPLSYEIPETPPPLTVRAQIEALVLEQTFLRVMVGGPFGYEGQLLLTRRNPAFDFWGRNLDFLQIVKRRQLLWKKCDPWTKGLAGLFDSTQEELNFQYSLLTEDTRRVEPALIELSPFERISYAHLRDMRRSSANSRNLSQDEWLKLFDALDNSNLAIDDELTGVPARVLAAVRKKGRKIASWKDCYQSAIRTLLENGRTYVLRRQVMHAVHNAVKKAEYKLDKVWSQSSDFGRRGRSK